jgi:hypothetical protein
MINPPLAKSHCRFLNHRYRCNMETSQFRLPLAYRLRPWGGFQSICCSRYPVRRGIACARSFPRNIPAILGHGATPVPRSPGTGNREGVLSPGNSWARSDQTVSPGTTEETSVRAFSFTPMQIGSRMEVRRIIHSFSGKLLSEYGC